MLRKKKEEETPWPLLFVVRLIRLELTRPKAPDPKSGVSTNSTTSAELGAKVLHFPETTK